MAKPKKIMVVHPVGDPMQVPILRGISDYAREQDGWILQISPEMSRGGLRHLVGWPGHGVIAVLRTKADVSAACSLPVPVVNLSGALRGTGVPRVMVDQEAMGRIAAEHLLACGLTRFAYYGERDMWYSQQRRQGFVERLSAAGHDCSVLESATNFGPRNPWYRWMEPLEKWLQALAPPVGLLAVHDYAGAVLIDACQRLRLRVPDDVAVIGIGDDPITCEFCEVSLSSVARSNREVGYEAAALLDRLMAGKPPPPADVLIAPGDVVKRRSTDVVAVEEPQVAAAVHYIHAHLAEPLCVETLWKNLSISHRLLDLRFQEALGCTPREFICRTRIERAKQLLAGQERLKLQRIARACGFSGPRHLCAAFRRTVGMTPTEYRQQMRDPTWSPRIAPGK